MAMFFFKQGEGLPLVIRPESVIICQSHLTITDLIALRIKNLSVLYVE